MKTDIENINDYLKNLPVDVKDALQRLRDIIHKTAPGVEELISYGMPAFKYHGMLVYFAVFKNHCSLFGGNGSLTTKMKEDLKDFKTTKGSIHFTVQKQLPALLIKKIIKARMQENILKQQNKTK